MIRNGKLQIITSRQERVDAPVITLDQLEQKFLLQKGILLQSFNKYTESQQTFLECINTGKTGCEVDIRIKRECGRQLQHLAAREGTHNEDLE